jgi:beta-lactamase regulating signal transducer with metallopeptidase domain/tetratricopeptide (TPR) repeat protein
MSMLSVFESQDLAGLLITLAAQSILISLLGIAVMKLLSGRSAPVRRLVCTGTLAALGLVLVVSIGFRLSGIAWSQFNETSPAAGRAANSTSTSGQDSVPLPLEISPTPQLGSRPFTGENGQVGPAMELSSKSFQLPAAAILSINILGTIWLCGFLFQLLRLGYGVVLVKRFRAGLSKVPEGSFHVMVGAIATTFWKNRHPELYTSPRIESPITIGLLNPVVIIPDKLFGNLKENELKSILLHELAHIYHYDHVIGVIKRIVLAAHWWNPLVYIINSEHELAGEEVSDNYVLHELHPKVYSQCLADLAEKACLVGNYPSAAAMAGRRFSLGERVEHILSKKRSIVMRTGSWFKTAVFAVCAVCALCVAGLQGQVETEKRESTAWDTQNTGLSGRSDTSLASLFFESRNLTPEKVAELEALVEQDPHDLRSQSLLLTYYMNRQSTDETARSKREQTVLWLIENHPDAEVLGQPQGQLRRQPQQNDEVAELWKQQLDKHPDNLQVIWNAGNYFLIGYIDQAIDCYELGKSLDPENATKWNQRLGQVYEFKMRRSSESEKQVWADESLRSLENAYAESRAKSFTFQAPGYPHSTYEFPNFEKATILPRMAKAALKAGDLDKAADYANQMLSSTESNPNDGDFIYNGNFVLGMIAVQNGNLDAAVEYLLAAGDTSGSPVLNSFGPNMSLAKELLDRGERDVVLAFLKKCMKFWSSEFSPCSRWIQEMEEGRTPDFSGHLNY